MFQQSSNQAPGTPHISVVLTEASTASHTHQRHRSATHHHEHVPNSCPRLRRELQHAQCSVQSNELLSPYWEQTSYKLPSSTCLPEALKAADTFSYNKHFLWALCHFFLMVHKGEHSLTNPPPTAKHPWL